MAAQSITKERMLNELTTAHFASDLPISLTSLKFLAMLSDKGFAAQARVIVSRKIEAIHTGDIIFQDSAAQIRTTRAWQRVLAKIDESLYPAGQKLG